MRVSKVEKYLVVLGLILSIIGVFSLRVLEWPDSHGYIEAWDNISNYRVDVSRTPSYPLYLGIVKSVFGEANFKIISILGQYLFFVCSAICFYRLLAYYALSGKRQLVLSIIYLLCPIFFIWCNSLLTEAFSISGLIFLLYSVILLYEKNSIYRVFKFFFWLVFLLMLRPSYIYLPIILLLFWFFMYIKERKLQYISGIVSVVMAGGLFLLYCYSYKQSYGVFTPSNVSTINRYYIARQYGLLSPCDITDRGLKLTIMEKIGLNGEFVNDEKVMWEEIHDVFASHKLLSIEKSLNNSVKNAPVKYIKNILFRVYKVAGYVYVYICFLLVYLFVLIFWIKSSCKIPYLSLLIFLVGLSNLLLVIVGSPASWGRLNVSAMPLYLIMLGQLSVLPYRALVQQISFK